MIWREVEYYGVVKVTQNAVGFDSPDQDAVLWIPKSVIAPKERDNFDENDGQGTVAVAAWFVDKEDIDYVYEWEGDDD